MINREFRKTHMPTGGGDVGKDGRARSLSLQKALSTLGIISTRSPVTANSAAWLVLAGAAPNSTYPAVVNWIQQAQKYFELCDVAGIPHALGLLESIALHGRGQVEAVAIEPTTLFCLVSRTGKGIKPLTMHGMTEAPEAGKMYFIPAHLLDAMHQAVMTNCASLN